MSRPNDIPQDVWDAAVRQYRASEGLGFIDIASKCILEERARVVQAVINAPSLDENGYICEKSAVLAALSWSYK